MGTQRKERISAENLTARGKSFDLKNKKMTKESIRIFWLTEKLGKNCIYRHHIEPKSSTYVPREESFLISQELHFWTKMRGRIGEGQNIWGNNKFNCIWYCRERTEFFIVTLRKNSFRWKRSQESSSPNFLWRWKQAHVVSSRGTAYLWDTSSSKP